MNGWMNECETKLLGVLCVVLWIGKTTIPSQCRKRLDETQGRYGSGQASAVFVPSCEIHNNKAP